MAAVIHLPHHLDLAEEPLAVGGARGVGLLDDLDRHRRGIGQTPGAIDRPHRPFTDPCEEPVAGATSRPAGPPPGPA